MDDWAAEADEARGRAAQAASCGPRRRTARPSRQLAELIAGAASPALVVGAGADDPDTWDALVALAERLGCPVWQESFSARAGFPQDHPLFAGHLPADRTRLRETLAPHDVVLAVGAPVFRQYPYVAGPVRRGRERGSRWSARMRPRCIEATPSSRVLAHPAAVCAELARIVPARDGTPPASFGRPAPPAPPAAGEPLRAGHVFAALAERLPRNAS